MEEEDLGGRAPLEEAGPPSKPPTPGTFPRRRPPVLHIALESAVRMGACAGESLLGLGYFSAFADKRDSGIVSLCNHEQSAAGRGH